MPKPQKNNIVILQEQAYQDALASFSIRPVDQDVVVLRLANVRKLPTTQSDIVTTLQGGTRLTATGDVRGLTWTRLDLNGSPRFRLRHADRPLSRLGLRSLGECC